MNATSRQVRFWRVAARAVLAVGVMMLLAGAGSPGQVLAAVPPVPTVSAAITGPGLMYPNPPDSVVPAEIKVEDFPYLTEEYFVSGIVNAVPLADERTERSAG